jgi:hypothetical protein
VSLSASERWKRPLASVPLWRAVAMVAACLLTLWGCGGGGGSGSGGAGSLNVHPVWPQPGGGESTALLPAAAQTVRITFDSEAGFQCCLAVDPTTVPIDPLSGLRLLVLDQLPPGPATFTLTAFATDFAPARDGVIALCATSPPGVGRACDATRPDNNASFQQSQPQPVTIVAGTRPPAIDLGMVSYPFVFDLQPPPNDSAASPVPVAFTAADAVTGVDGNSIEVWFRALTKRPPETKQVAVKLNSCDDKTASPCSEQGYLQVMGFSAVSDPISLLPGRFSLSITVKNQASPPEELDFTYEFTVVGDGQAAIAPAGTFPLQSLAPSAGDRTDLVTVAEQQASGTTITLPVVTAGANRTATNTAVPFNHVAVTPTATATPTPAEIVEGTS